MKDKRNLEYIDELREMQFRELERLGQKFVLKVDLFGEKLEIVQSPPGFVDDKKSIVEKKITQTKEVPIKQWFTLKEACELKGINFKTACNKSYLKPNCGKPDGIIAGRKSWKLETILKWIDQTDDELMSIYKSRRKT